jgi:hypothetical protein
VIQQETLLTDGDCGCKNLYKHLKRKTSATSVAFQDEHVFVFLLEKEKGDGAGAVEVLNHHLEMSTLMSEALHLLSDLLPRW